MKICARDLGLKFDPPSLLVATVAAARLLKVIGEALALVKLLRGQSSLSEVRN